MADAEEVVERGEGYNLQPVLWAVWEAAWADSQEPPPPPDSLRLMGQELRLSC